MQIQSGRIVWGASKIKLKKVNKTRTATVRRVTIFLNISRRQLLICLHCCLHQYKTLKVVATAKAAIILLTPAKNLNKVFWGFQWSPHCLIIIKDMYKYIRGWYDPKQLIPKPFRGSKSPLIWRFIKYFRSKKFACKISPKSGIKIEFFWKMDLNLFRQDINKICLLIAFQ